MQSRKKRGKKLLVATIKEMIKNDIWGARLRVDQKNSACRTRVMIVQLVRHLLCL